MEDSSFSLDQLQPGRNYSVVVAAVSNNIDSINNNLIYQETSKFSFLFHATAILFVVFQCFCLKWFNRIFSIGFL